MSVFVLGLALRVAGFWWLADGSGSGSGSVGTASNSLQQRVELANVMTSWKAVQECLFLARHEAPLYDGGICHQPPLLIMLIDAVPRGIDALGFNAVVDAAWVLRAVFIIADLLIAWLLYRVAAIGLERPAIMQAAWESVTTPPSAKGDSASPSPSKKSRALAAAQLTTSPSSIAALYLLNPYTLLSTLAQSTSIFTNVAIAAALYSGVRGRGVLAMTWLAVGGYLSFYPWMLVPAAMLLVRKCDRVVRGRPRHALVYTMLLSVFTLVLAALFSGSFLYMAGTAPAELMTTWSRIDLFSPSVVTATEVLRTTVASTWFQHGWLQFKAFMVGVYGIILMMPDLSPNLGLYWYLFTEFFDSFRSFFIIVVQLMLAAFVLPLTVKFRSDPLFCMCLLTGIIAFFKSYPTMGDVAFWLMGILPLQRKIFPYLRNPFLSLNLLFFSTALLPAFHHTWVYAGSGNANFFYAITLLWGLGGALLLLDVVHAWLRRGVEMYVQRDATKWRDVAFVMK